MKYERVYSKRRKQNGFRYRYVDPTTHKRERVTFWTDDKLEAAREFVEFLEARRREAHGQPGAKGWTTPYEDLVRLFLDQAEISSQVRRDALRVRLELNPLKIRTAADLRNVGALRKRARDLVGTVQYVQRTKRRFKVGWSPYNVKHGVQKALKQLTRWAASDGLLPYDPLSRWSPLKGVVCQKRPAFNNPAELRDVLAASDELDGILNHKLLTRIPLLAFLVTGNRPSAVLSADVADFRDGRIYLPEGNGRKRNGLAALPEEFQKQLSTYLRRRDRPGQAAPLFVTARGHRPEAKALARWFTRCQIIAAVSRFWPENHPAASVTERASVAQALYYRRVPEGAGRKPLDERKRRKRQALEAATEAIADTIREDVDRWIGRRTLYSLKHTMITWARRLHLDVTAINAQVGHTGASVQERHYVDAVDPRPVAEAVWSVLTGAIDLAEIGRIPRSKAIGFSGVLSDELGDANGHEMAIFHPNTSSPRPVGTFSASASRDKSGSYKNGKNESEMAGSVFKREGNKLS